MQRYALLGRKGREGGGLATFAHWCLWSDSVAVAWHHQIWSGYNKLPYVQKINFTEYPASSVRNEFSFLTTAGFDLLMGMLTYDPKKRISADQALDHPSVPPTSPPSIAPKTRAGDRVWCLVVCVDWCCLEIGPGPGSCVCPSFSFLPPPPAHLPGISRSRRAQCRPRCSRTGPQSPKAAPSPRTRR